MAECHHCSHRKHCCVCSAGLSVQRASLPLSASTEQVTVVVAATQLLRWSKTFLMFLRVICQAAHLGCCRRRLPARRRQRAWQGPLAALPAGPPLLPLAELHCAAARRHLERTAQRSRGTLRAASAAHPAAQFRDAQANQCTPSVTRMPAGFGWLQHAGGCHVQCTHVSLQKP